MNDNLTPKGVEFIQLPQYVDERGALCFMECQAKLSFDVKRIFWIKDVPLGKVRGGHAHWTCHEAVFPVAGSFEIEVDDGEVRRTFLMDDPSVGITVPAGVWCELRHFAVGTVCVVLASESYNPKGYALTREEWRRGLSRRK